MKRLLIAAAVLAAGLVPSVQAQTAPVKVAVIAFQAAVSQTNEFQRDFADLDKRFDPKRNELKGLAAELESLNKDLQAQGDKLSEAELARRKKTLDEKQKQAQRLSEDAQNDFQTEMQAIANRVATKFGEVMQQYAIDHGYTMAIDVTQGEEQAPVVLWADSSINITQVVIDAYNVKSGVPAPAAPPTK